MTHPISPGSSASPQFPRAAIFWICALVGGIGIAASSAVYDRGHRQNLEKAVERTAVGDKTYFPLAEREKLQLRFLGEALVISTQTPDPMPESRMILSGETEGTPFRLYVPAERANGNGEVGGPSWYLKTGHGEFLRVTR
jgi:hypothetical protein